ncbi:type II secretion system protein N [Salinimonas marina]|uniref:Type II secretion system protein N n=1 Tax=Salinimonas marina TaxID=2785918 RepID=A0A7S9DX40_9ALTE|nr:type II secretion system protein N [Salinimonas marina]QPG05577.1 type II secretion system protein N [Salinimonas marina]
MKFRIGWLLAALLVWLFLMVWYLPANQVIGRITLPPQIEVYGVSGTVWKGKARQVDFNQLPVSQVRWEINPLALLWGRLSLEVTGGNDRDPQAISFAGPVSMSVFSQDNVRASDFQLYLPVDRVLAKVPLPLPVNASGRFRAHIRTLNYEGRCEALDGRGNWLNAAVSGTQGPIDFGTYTATLSCKDGNFAIEVSEPNRLGLSMAAEVGAQFDQVAVKGQFKPDDSLPAEVHQAARLFGQPNSQGYTTFQL